MRRTDSARPGLRSNVASRRNVRDDPAFAVCVDPGDEHDLIRGRVYRVVDDDFSAEVRLIRIVDNSGEDYLYPRGDFRVIRLPADVAALSLRLD